MATMEVATTIWGQISQNTKWACGAQFPTGSENSLTFTVRIKPGVRHKVEVVLDPSDTYTVRLHQIRGASSRVVEEHSDVYCDELSELVYRMCNPR